MDRLEVEGENVVKEEKKGGVSPSCVSPRSRR
jgi:hypothetical protein